MGKQRRWASDILDKFLDKFIDQILAIVISAVIVPWIMSMAGMFSLIKVTTSNNPFFWMMLFMVILTITISASAIFFIFLYRKLKKIYRRYEFKFEMFESELNFPISGDYITQTIHFRYRVLCDKLNTIPHCFVWTGRAIKNVQLDDNTLEAGYTLDLSRLNEKLSVIKINFPETKFRDDTGVVKFTLDLEGADDMKPCLRKNVNFQIDTLILRVRAPNGLINDVKPCAYTSLENKEILLDDKKLTKKDSHPEITEYELREDDPILSYSYAIKWSFE